MNLETETKTELLHKLAEMADIIWKSMEDKKQYSPEDLITFGNYLLSEKRKEMYLNHPHQNNIGDRMKMVHHSDIMNAFNG